MKKKLILTAALFLLASSKFLYAQGCSDAGVCTMNSFKPHDEEPEKQLFNQFKIGSFIGLADNSILVFGNYAEYNRQINDRFGVDVKLTTLAQQGNGINTYGLSDVFLNANYRTAQNIRFTVGAKVPLTNADRSNNNLPLPMDYQSSLGTIDFIFGVGYEINKFQLVAALQQPLTQNNNQFIASNYPVDSKLRTIQSTNKFERAGDVLLRVSYPFSIHSKWKLTPSILPIYHLSNDKYTDEFNVTKEINNSQGLTLNGNVYLDYEINSKSGLQFNAGMPFIVRDARPDGLTRAFVANVEYRVRF